MPNPNEGSPILLAATDHIELTILRLTFEIEGIPIAERTNLNEIPNFEHHPLSILCCNSITRTNPWLEYIERGGVLVACNPNNNFAAQLGLENYEGTTDSEVVLYLRLFENGESVPIQILGAVSKYSRASGSVKGLIREKGSSSKQYPGIVEYSVGQGKVLILLFSLASLISHFHQRTSAVASKTGRGSAERIALAGVKKEFLKRPQIDLIVGFLTRFIMSELCRLDKPIPRIGYFPCGYRSLITFSFDDFCPSGKAMRLAVSRLIENLKAIRSMGKYWLGIYRSLKKLLEEIIRYPHNYETHVRQLISLFTKYGASGSAYILPFFGPIKNKVALTGYKGFSKRSYLALKEADWDVGTHIKPMALSDYDRSQRKFERRFGLPPAGHRGHQLGWVEWDKDWQCLAELGYLYDSTWNWGGHNGLTWILGTAFPFHPVDRNGEPLTILEIPVVAWIKDIYKTPEKSLPEIETMLDRYPGVFNFAGHSWRVTDGHYFDFIEEILKLAQRKHAIALGLNLARFSKFWKCRELSGIERLHWDKKEGLLSFVSKTRCESEDLTIYIPYFWRDHKVLSIYINNRSVKFGIQDLYGVDYSIITVQRNNNNVVVKYG